MQLSDTKGFLADYITVMESNDMKVIILFKLIQTKENVHLRCKKGEINWDLKEIQCSLQITESNFKLQNLTQRM